MVATKTPSKNGSASKKTVVAEASKSASKEKVAAGTSSAKAVTTASNTKVKAEAKAKAKTDTKDKAVSSSRILDPTMAKTKTPAKKEKTSAKAKKGTEVSAVDKIYEENETLRTAVQQIEAQFGSGSIMTLNGDNVKKIRGVSTGSLSLDMALGGSGLPCGRIIEVYGPESSGKTTLALHAVAQAQKKGGIAAIVDAEHAFDPTWAKKLGVSLDTLLVSQPSSGEEAMQIVEMLVKSNAVDVIIVDSVAALVPKKELEGEIGDSHVGLQARLMSQSMRKLTGAIARSKTCTIFINQILSLIHI